MDLIVNVSENWGIGIDGDQLVYIPEDLHRFRAMTLQKTLIVGRKTLSAFPGGRPLPERVHLVLSTGEPIKGAFVYRSLEALLAALKQMDTSKIMVVGGASVYQALLPYCEKAYITKTYGSYPADTFFPNLDQHPDWIQTEDSPVFETSQYRFQYLVYQNRNPKAL